MKRHDWSGLATAAVLCGALLVAAPPSTEARAQQDPPAEGEDVEAKKDSRQSAKEARIAEYLRKREERRIRREQRTLEQEAARQEALAEAARKKQEAAVAAELPDADESAAGAVAAEQTSEKRSKAAARRRGSKLPRGLARAQESVRSSRLGQDPNIQEYLNLVERQEASPQQLGAIGNFLAQAGLGREAMEYYGVALRLDKKDPVLWINSGTLHRQAGRTGPAIGAFMRALALDGNNAVAHYNLGAAYDAQGKYEEALESYKIALRLDPELGNPAVNPQAANNDHLTTVKLMLYREQAGSLGIPMIKVPGGELKPVEETKN